jgi:hypothetical protein
LKLRGGDEERREGGRERARAKILIVELCVVRLA